MTTYNNSLNEYIDICISSNGSQYDVSKVIYELIKNKYMYCGKNIWKYNLDGNYVIDDKNDILKKELKSDIINKFIERSTYWDDKSINEKDINISISYQIKSSILLQIANKLKDNKYLNSIIKELKQFFSSNIDE